MDQLSFFDLNDRLEQISKIGDPLEVLNEMVDWSKFDGILLRAKVKDLQERNVNGNAGRKPFSLRLMLKVFILQSLYNLSDDQMEYQIKDRLSFMRFLGLGLNGTVPDAKTIWNYREMFIRTKTWEKLFRKFDRMLEEKGLFAKGGSIIDATVVNVPVQRNKGYENEIIKDNKVPEEWKSQPAKLAQKDVDARWGSKHGTYTFGYKAHVVADNKNKIVRNVIVTAANVHDSNVYGKLLKGDRNTSKDVWADSGYVGSSNPLPEGYREHVCKKGFRGKPLTEFQEKCNIMKSRIRCRIEHVFGWVKGNHELFVRTIGKARAKAKILASFITYNMFRMVALARPKWAQPA